MPTLEEIRNRFKNDHFATDATGVIIDSAQPGKALGNVPEAVGAFHSRRQ